MKIEQLIVQYLYNNKVVTLQDIGTFTVADDITILTDIEKDTVLPENAIQFKYEPKAGVDQGLIEYVIENTRKIRPLATSDLESYVMLNKQFLNIGKPLTLEGVGILQKVNDGSYSFTQSNTSHVVLKDTPKIVTEKIIEKITFATPEKEKNIAPSKWIIAGIISFIIVGGAIAAYILLNKKSVTQPVEETLVNTNKNNIEKENTIVNTPTAAISKPLVLDSNTFYVVIKDYTNIAVATQRMKTLTGYGNNIVLTTKDSITYKLRMPFKVNLQDTLRIKDSLNKFFKANTYIELP